MAKDKDNIDSKAKLNDESYSTIKTCDSQKEKVIVEDITNNESDSDDDSCEPVIPRVVEAQVYDDTEEFSQILNNKGKHYLETNTLLYPSCIKGLPNKVFVMKGNADNFDQKIKELLKKDNQNMTDEGFY